MPGLSGVLVTYRRPKQLIESLEALAAQTSKLDHLVVVDNDLRSVGVPTDLPAAANHIEYVLAGANLGPAGGIALGMQRLLSRTGDDDLIFTFDDDDALVDHDVIRDVADHFYRSSDPLLAGVGLHGATMNRWTGRLRRAGATSAPVRVGYLKGGSCPGYRVSAIRDIGPFREDLFWGWEELEFGLRLRANGYRLESWSRGRPDITGYRSPSAQFSRSPWRTYYSTRNLVVVLWSNDFRWAATYRLIVMGLLKPVFQLLRHPRAARTQPAMAFRGAIDSLRGRLGLTVVPSRVTDVTGSAC